MPPKISATKFSTKKPKTPTKSIAPVKRNASNSKCKKALIVVTTGKVQAKAVSKGDKKKVVNRKTIIAKATVNVKMVLKKKVQKKTETQVAAGGKGVGKKGQIQGQNPAPSVMATRWSSPPTVAASAGGGPQAARSAKAAT